MTRKRFSDEDALNVLRQIELEQAAGNSVESACRTAGISDATYYKWRKLYGGMGKSQLRELKAMEPALSGRCSDMVEPTDLPKLFLPKRAEAVDWIKEFGRVYEM